MPRNKNATRRHRSAIVAAELGGFARMLARAASGWRKSLVRPGVRTPATLERVCYIAQATQDAADLLQSRIVSWQIREEAER